MMRIAAFVVLTLFILPAVQASSESSSWTHEFESGYITTKPLFVGDDVFVRTSGFWTGDDRPIVAAFDVETGDEIWTYTSQTSLQFDMSPLLFANNGAGDCGQWSDLLIVGWADGKITAHSPTQRSVIWENQTEVDAIGISGRMVLDEDRVIVPTRTGISSFCLADGSELMDVDTGNIGWRNGVTIIQAGYVFGDELGYIHEVDRNGSISTTFLGDGKIRHPPIETRHGLFVHLQRSQGSTMFLNGTAIAQLGPSPAIPVYHENRIYAATSEEWVSILCDDQTCAVDSTVSFRSNGEMGIRVVDSNVEVWAPSNTPNGGWGVFNQTALIRMETTEFDTFGTSAPGFSNMNLALGNDAGILLVKQYANYESPPQSSDADVFGIVHYAAVLVFFLLTCFSLALQNPKQIAKLGSAFVLLVAIAVVPELSVKLAENNATQGEVEWDDDWPDEWKGTQVMVFEIDGQQHAIGGLEPQTTVYELTTLACEELGITTQIEQQYLGAYLVSFNGSIGDG